jgi:hypothetical protein
MEKVIPVMGPGCGNKDLEHCPPSYHFELTEQELMEAVRDPNAMAKRLGVEPGIDTINISAPRNQAASNARTIYCCIRCLSNSWCCTPWPQ